MEAPKCKICHLHHYGLCKVERDKGGKITSVSIPPQPEASVGGDKTRYGDKLKRPKKSSGVATCPADGEAGGGGGMRAAHPANPTKRDDQASEATVGSGAISDGMVAGGQTHSDIESINAILYRPDGSINEEAARAGHNAYMKLAMRKYRAKKDTERSGG